MKTHSAAAGPVLEALEARLAPAGVVLLTTTASGVLTVAGDAGNNTLMITHNSSTGMWDVDDLGTGTSFKLNGVDMGSSFSMPAQNSINADFKAGNDEFYLRPSSSASGLVLSGGLNIKMGDGHDTFRLGWDSFRAVTVGGAVTIDGGSGDDTLSIFTHASFAGAVKILGGTGNDNVQLQGLSAVQTYLKGLSVDLGAGSDQFQAHVKYLNVTGALAIKGAGAVGQNQTVILYSDETNISGLTSVALAAGISTIHLGNESTDQITLGGGLKVTGGSGNDLVSFRGDVNSAKAITLDLKAGPNTTFFDTDGSLHTASLSIMGGNGVDAVMHQTGFDLVVHGALTLKTGAGSASWIGGGAGTRVMTGSFTIQTGADTDGLYLTPEVLHVSGAMKVTMGNGGSGFEITSAVSAFIGGGFTFSGGTGNDSVEFSSPDFRIGGAVQLQMGAGSNSFFALGGNLHVGGNITYVGGVNSDYLTLNNTQTTVVGVINFNGGSAGINYLNVVSALGNLGGVTYLGGSALDQLLLGNSDSLSTERMAINGNVSFKPGAGHGSLYLTDALVQGTLQVVSSTKAGENDDINFHQSFLHGKVSIVHGAGDSNLSVTETYVRNDFSLSTGAGDDVVELGNDSGRAFKNQWFGKVLINAGSGNDSVFLGQLIPADANVGNVFYSAITMDGGTQSTADTLVHGGNLYRSGVVLDSKNFP